MKLEDLYKLLITDKPSENIKNNEKEIFELIPELKSCKGFDQNNKWHIYDVYEHILHVVDNVSNNIVIRLAALFHDIGKPESYTIDDEGIGHFYGHWVISQNIFDKFAIKYNIDKNISYIVSNLIYYHDISINKLNNDELKELINKLGSDGIELLFELKRADLLAQNQKYHYLLDEYDKEKTYVLSKI